MRIDVYHHTADYDVALVLARIERSVINLRDEVRIMAETLAVEVQQTREAFQALRDAVSSKLEALIVTIGELRDQLTQGGLSQTEEAAAAEALDGVQTEMTALKAAVEAAGGSPQEP